MPSALTRTPPGRTPLVPAAALLRRASGIADAQRLPPVRRLRAGGREVPTRSRIILLRHGIVALR